MMAPRQYRGQWLAYPDVYVDVVTDSAGLAKAAVWRMAREAHGRADYRDIRVRLNKDRETDGK